jgi:hypothetical protein
MKTKTNKDRGRTLVLRRETLRALSSLTPDELARAAGGQDTFTCPKTVKTVGTGSKYCH